MNKLLVIFCIMLVFGINGCNNKKISNETISEVENPDSPRGLYMTGTKDIVADETDISMSIHDISSGGLSFVFENTSEKNYIYGSDYKLYVLKNNVWEPVEPIIENWGFTSEAYYIQPQSKTDIVMIDWRWLFGELSVGEYKFEKRILFSRSPGDYDTFLVAQSFILQ